VNNVLEYNGYLGSVEYSSADEVFFGRVLGISDRITYDGDSVATLKQDFVSSIEDYIESCAEIGKEAERSYNGNLDIQIEPDLHRKLVSYSLTRNQSLDKTVKEALSVYVG